MKGTTGIKSRRSRALNMLETQLKKGTKPEKIDGRTTNKSVQLTEDDKKRIKREIENIKAKK